MKPGDVFVLTDGEFEEYRVLAVLRATEAFDFDAEVEAYEYPPFRQHAGHEYSFQPDGFVQSLVERGLAERASVPVIFLGAVGRPRDAEKKARDLLAKRTT